MRTMAHLGGYPPTLRIHVCARRACCQPYGQRHHIMPSRGSNQPRVLGWIRFRTAGRAGNQIVTGTSQRLELVGCRHAYVCYVSVPASVSNRPSASRGPTQPPTRLIVYKGVWVAPNNALCFGSAHIHGPCFWTCVSLNNLGGINTCL